MVSTRPPGFFIAPFVIDGESEGIDYWEIAKLSGKWLAICADHLEKHGSSFDAPWPGHLSYLSTRLTAASGAALVTFRVHGKLASSVALASGRSPAADAEVLKLFVESLRRVRLVVASAQSLEPFEKMLAIVERPVMVVVPWPDTGISDQDHAVVRELELHTAGAFFSAAGQCEGREREPPTERS
jgi:hypothetical protein